MDIKFKHSEEVHNLKSPKEIVPILIDLLKPVNVLDVGCGVGAFLYCFKEQGVKEVLGLDGPWVNQQMLQKYLKENEFKEIDLEKSFDLEKKFDLVLNLEVAEHVSESSADNLVNSLINSGKFIVFGAAIPYQGGQNHVNEQWLTYWEEKFNDRGYVLHDILRPIFWDNPNIFTWHKQNMVIFAPSNIKFDHNLKKNPIKNIVHYNLFIDRHNMLTKTIKANKIRTKTILDGQLGAYFYVKLLIKSIIGIKNLNKIKLILKH